MARLCFLDLETTGLDPDRHDVWEIGLIVRTEPGTDDEYLWRVQPDMATADPNGLRIGRFYERTKQHTRGAQGEVDLAEDPTSPYWSDPAAVAWRLAHLLDGEHIVGAVPSFDAAFLRRWLPRHGQAFTAHYHLIDIESMAVGYLHGIVRQATDTLAARDLPYNALRELPNTVASPPWDSDVLSRALGLDPDTYERHTALGDARWVRDQYDAITTGRPVPPLEQLADAGQAEQPGGGE